MTSADSNRSRPRSCILALDLCGPAPTVAAVDARTGRHGGLCLPGRPNQASEHLAEGVRAALAAGDGSMEHLAAVAVTTGPGTFTGIRVGAAFAFGVALGRSVPVLPLDPLAVIARAARREGRILACLDARKGEVYGAVYHVEDETVRRLCDPACVPLSDLAARLPWELAAGPGADAHGGEIPDGRHVRGVLPTPEALALEALAAHRAGRALAPEQLEVTYLRRTYAELGIHRPKRPVYRSPLLDDDD